MAQTKTQQAERNIRNSGYSIEYCRSPRGNKLCKAIKEGEKIIYATNLISLEKLVNAAKPVMNKFQLSGHQKYFSLNIHQRINERQQRNSLNINHLFSTVITQSEFTATYPKVNNGLYHHIGKTHSKYPVSHIPTPEVN